jgi:hypothetical protein
LTIYNERVKLFAAALNGAAVASVALGVIAPLVTAFHFGGAARDPLRTAVEVSIWLFVAIVLHLGGQLVLGGLRRD